MAQCKYLIQLIWYLFFKLRFVKTCLQLASSDECNLQVRQDHFDQMSRMIQESNIGKIF